MGTEQTIYANKTSEIAQTISSSIPPQNPQEIANHSKNLLSALGEAKAKAKQEGLSADWLIWMD